MRGCDDFYYGAGPGATVFWFLFGLRPTPLNIYKAHLMVSLDAWGRLAKYFYFDLKREFQK